MVQDGQNDFTGGMNDRLAPERLAANEYAYGENLEIRRGSADTRRGTFCYYTFNEGYTLNGAAMYYGPADDQRNETLIQVLGSQVWRMNIPQPPVLMATPSSEAPGTCRFVQAYDAMYMLRGENYPVWKWLGRTNTWETLTAPTAGDSFPNAEYGIYAYNRIWLVTDRDTVVASDIFSEAFDLTLHSWDINAGEGGQVMAIKPFADGSLLIFKDNSIWLVTGCNGDLTNMYAQVIDPKHGAVSRDSVVSVGNDVWYLSKDGIRSVILTTENNAQLEDIPVSFNIPNLIARINWNMAYKAQSAVIDNYALFAVPVDSATENNAMLVYDLLLKKWVGIWTGMTAKRFVTSLENGESLFTVSNTGSVEKMLADPYNDHRGKEPFIRIVTRAFYSDAAGSAAWGIIQKTTGILEMDVMVPPALAGSYMTLLAIAGTATTTTQHPTLFIESYDYENLYLHSYLYIDSAPRNDYWEAHTTTLNLQSNYPRHITLVQNGTEPKLYVDGIEYALTFTETHNKGYWFNGAVKINTVAIRKYDVDYVDLYDLKITSLDQSATYLHVGADEGSGSYIYDSVSGLPLTLTGATWYESTPAAITTRLDTRAFSFQTPANKTVSRGLITVGHRQPSYTVSYRGKEAAWTASALAAKTYSLTAYDIHGSATYDNTGARFNEAYRQDYSPLTLPVAGMKVPSEGWLLDRETEHTEQFNCRLVTPHAQLRVANTTGTLAVKEIMLQGEARAQSNKGR